MPDAVEDVVHQLVKAAREKHSSPDGRFLGYCLHGGPGGADYLDADGEVWSWSVWDDSVEHVPDGPRKVGGVAIAAERVPELAAWLPARPANAEDCSPCRGTGNMLPPLPNLQCPECFGMGWVEKRQVIETQ
jgi:hypothetical protein